ncbi:MAG: sugar phosphate isomerase/epimerase family protein [Bacillota bacterium]|nr:sugar phosphate isomerase/epimerase family protein [Bacillota bacterium]
MKIYSVAWGWTPVPEDMPQGDSLLQIADQVAALGFDGIDYLSTFESLDSYFTAGRCRRIREHCAGLGLDIGGFVFQSSNWNNPDPAVTSEQLRFFAKCALAAVELGAGTISCIIPGPFGARGTRAGASPSEPRSLKLPADYSWQQDWDRFVGSLTQAVDIAADHGLRVALECFPGSLCSTPHAMLQVLRDVGRPNFGIQLDTAHLMNQHIDVETAVYMLGGKNILNVHLKDSDGLTRGNLPPGSGLIDYVAFLAALKNVGYEGTASIEVEFTDNPRRYMKQGLGHIRQILDGTL